MVEKHKINANSSFFKYIHEHVQALNSSKIFAGIMIITLNIVSRFVNIKLSKTMESYLKYTFSKYVLVFTIAWMGTRDIYIAFFIMSCFVIISDFLFDEESMFCILPEEFKDHHLTILQENEDMENITDEEITKAKKVIEKAKIQNKDNELESYKI
tara:strand:- start:440 stop:907 length:468 start_codon:yes stop_codon:yes gene_type:complete